MELYEKNVSGRGEILALYSQGLKLNPKGTFFFRNKGGSRAPSEVVEAKDWNSWELMVLLTGLGIIHQTDAAAERY
jgi:hypothetical protein